MILFSLEMIQFKHSETALKIRENIILKQQLKNNLRKNEKYSFNMTSAEALDG